MPPDRQVRPDPLALPVYKVQPARKVIPERQGHPGLLEVLERWVQRVQRQQSQDQPDLPEPKDRKD